MKKIISAGFFILFSCIQFTACNSVTPEKYFGIAVLNTNMLFGFAGDGQLRQLESPSAKMSGNNGETVPMKRGEELNTKIQFVEENFGKLEDLKETEDTRDMLAASRALYEFVLSVYKNEYVQLADLYDSGAPKYQTLSLSNSIHDKYSSGYEKLYDNLIKTGKIYAEKNNIKVNWGVY
ncbi:MAG: hypothetical protein ABI840_10510 [bacterium]